MVVGGGFEPPYSPSKGDVLPLDDPTILGYSTLVLRVERKIRRKALIVTTNECQPSLIFLFTHLVPSERFELSKNCS